MNLVYAIFRPGGKDPPRISGINGEPVRYVIEGGMGAAYAEIFERARPEISAVLEFESVTEALCREFTLIPVRFGNYFENPDELRDFLRDNENQLARLLNDLSGTMEMGVRVLAQRLPSPEKRAGQTKGQPGGREYLEQRRSHFEGVEKSSGQRERLASMLREHFQGLFKEIKVETVEKASSLSAPPGNSSGNPRGISSEDVLGGHSLLSAYFLVPENRIEQFRQRYSQLSIGGAKFLLSGPWPPYNFADFLPASEQVVDRRLG